MSSHQQPAANPSGRTRSMDLPSSTGISKSQLGDPSASHPRPPLHSSGRHSMFVTQVSQAPSQQHQQKPEFNRENSLLRQLSTFVGIQDDGNEKSDWQLKAERRIQKKYQCKEKEQRKTRLSQTRSVDVSHGSRRVAFSPTVSLRADSHQAPSSSADTRQAIDTHSSLAGKDIHSDVAPFERDSALKVVWNSISNVITKGTAITHKRRPVPLRICKSFDIEQIEPETAAGGAGQGQGPRSAATTPHIIAGLRSPFSMSSRHYRDQHEQFEMSTLNADGRAHLATVSETEEGEAEPISRRGSERKEDEDAGLQMEVKKEREAQERRVAVAVASYADWPMMDMNENDAEEEIELHGGGLADTARPSNLRMSGRPLSKKTQSKPKDGGPKQIVKFYDSQYPVEFETSVPFMKDEEDDLINERFFDSGVSKKEQTITIGYTARDGGEENEAGMEEEPKTRIPRTGRERFPIEMRESMLPKKPIRLGPSPIIRHQPNGIPDRPDVVHTRSDIDQQLEIVKNRVKNILMSQQPRRTRGISKFGQLCGQKLRYKKVRKLRPELRNQIEQGEGERPFFTWWVTTVQIVVCLISILAYGFGPVGLSRKEMKKEVQDVTLSYRQVSYYEPSNIWFGPRFSDLIRLGAKYSPCMRREKKLWDVITMEREAENKTGCCVFNDRSGCYQTGKSSCPLNIATWVKWQRHDNFNAIAAKTKDSKNATLPRRDSMTSLLMHRSRTSGAVCGQDPDFCNNPPSVEPYEWPDDITKWPRCFDSAAGEFLPRHMTCQLSGRPCCIQLQGLCRIATKEYCNFVNGYWHENATLCSQVDCFSDVCGMIPFFRRDHPNQLYRLFISLFVHAGLLHLAITVLVQLWLMRDLEALIGWKRMALLYFVSGIGGNLASAIFVPFNPEVGPSGSQLGILAALLVDVYHHRSFIAEPWKAIGWLLLVVFLLFLAGLIPWVDNWAHLFGFIFGLLITIVTFPYLDFNPEEKTPAEKSNENEEREREMEIEREEASRRILKGLWRRRLAVTVSFVLMASLLGILGYFFIWNVDMNCPFCEYFNCINIKRITGSDHFCDNSGQELTKWLPI